MSSQLPSIDLSTGVAGSQYVLDFTAFVKFNPSNIPQNAHLVIYNESGCGLTCTMQQSGTQFFVPAGGWGTSNIAPNDATCKLMITYVITGAPVSTLIATYYAPGEEVPQSYTLGNSPVGGAVTTSGGTGVADHLINTGNAPSSSSIISITPSGSPGPTLVADNQGNVTFSTWNGATLFQLLQMVVGVKAITAYQYVAGQSTSANEARYDSQFNLGTNGIGVRIILGSDTSPTGFYAQAAGTPNNATGFNASSVVGMTGTANKAINVTGGFWNTGVDLTSIVTAGQVSLQWDHGQLLPAGVINSNAAFVATVNGSVSGTVQIFMPFQGSAYKFANIVWNNYQSASNASLTLPVSFTNFQYFTNSDIGVSGNGGIQFLNNVTAQTVTVTTTLALAGGTGQNATTVFKVSQGSLGVGASAIDHINIVSSTTAHTGNLIMIGA